MKPRNKPIRIHYFRGKKAIHKLNGVEPYNPWRTWGVTNWMVGTSEYPWSPWVQIHFGRASIQIKWYLVVGLGLIGSFMLGLWI